jgi:hypothetical protein
MDLRNPARANGFINARLERRRGRNRKDMRSLKRFPIDYFNVDEFPVVSEIKTHLGFHA